jgi:hypothetical protein
MATAKREQSISAKTPQPASDGIRLRDGRGCEIVYYPSGLDRFEDQGAAFYRGSKVWERMKFERQPERDAGGRRIYACAEPAIGTLRMAFHPTLLPEGWDPPAAQPES